MPPSSTGGVCAITWATREQTGEAAHEILFRHARRPRSPPRRPCDLRVQSSIAGSSEGGFDSRKLRGRDRPQRLRLATSEADHVGGALLASWPFGHSTYLRFTKRKPQPAD